jgi:uncharacterized cysteine cluster protein YcgN (CxxCxxCC family)
MKRNIKKEKYNDLNGSKMEWFSWEEVCDVCGKVCRANDVLSNRYPNTAETDYCLDCLRKNIDKMINKEDK